MKSKLKVFRLLHSLSRYASRSSAAAGVIKAPRRRSSERGALSELTGAFEDGAIGVRPHHRATFAEDGTFKLGMFGESMEGTWDAEICRQKVSPDVEGDSVDATIGDGVLLHRG